MYKAVPYIFLFLSLISCSESSSSQLESSPALDDEAPEYANSNNVAMAEAIRLAAVELIYAKMAATDGGAFIMEDSEQQMREKHQRIAERWLEGIGYDLPKFHAISFTYAAANHRQTRSGDSGYHAALNTLQSELEVDEQIVYLISGDFVSRFRFQATRLGDRDYLIIPLSLYFAGNGRPFLFDIKDPKVFPNLKGIRLLAERNIEIIRLPLKESQETQEGEVDDSEFEIPLDEEEDEEPKLDDYKVDFAKLGEAEVLDSRRVDYQLLNRRDVRDAIGDYLTRRVGHRAGVVVEGFETLHNAEKYLGDDHRFVLEIDEVRSEFKFVAGDEWVYPRHIRPMEPGSDSVGFKIDFYRWKVRPTLLLRDGWVETGTFEGSRGGFHENSALYRSHIFADEKRNYRVQVAGFSFDAVYTYEDRAPWRLQTKIEEMVENGLLLVWDMWKSVD